MFEFFGLSWETMTLFEKFYWCIAIPSSLLFILQVLLTFIGSDSHDIEADGNPDLSIEHDTGIDFQFLSIKNLIAFFTIFGWTGIICIDSNLSIWLTILISTICGLLMMLLMASIMYFMGKLTENGVFHLSTTIGKIGTVYLTIPGNRKGSGQIQIDAQGFRTIDAITDNNDDISTGSIIEVVDVLNNDILVVKISN
ncbi:hypothetical protein [Carboxylicivirga marina]|uniref:NfeD-like C-terminal domain-containing protein n=1 Tax=Carboxylicivirga marina TaxID=2800988 RepID=A0ABS1HHI4_9BACT|nr:hypothetical protein [Carboxylicivirga marina]MBK3517150.1 hypothetical protein [Carboxylicivirga marina]